MQPILDQSGYVSFKLYMANVITYDYMLPCSLLNTHTYTNAHTHTTHTHTYTHTYTHMHAWMQTMSSLASIIVC